MKPVAPSSRRSTAPAGFRKDPYPVDPRFLTPNPDEERQWMEDMGLCGYGKGGKRWDQ